MSDDSYLIKDLNKFDSIILQKDEKEELLKLTKEYLNRPKHLVFNLSMIENLSKEHLDIIHFLSTILKSDNYSVKLFSPPNSVSTLMGSHRFRNLPEIQDLAEHISEIETIDKKRKSQSLLKSFTDETMKFIFSGTDLIVKREEILIRESENEFYNESNYALTFEFDQAFFTLSLSGQGKFFSRLLETLKEENIEEVFNVILSKIPQELLDGVLLHKHYNCPYKSFPDDKITINKESYDYFRECSVMIIPFETSIGAFFLEMWVPRVFSSQVFKFLNP
jgi:tRNA nucleotidyltransferase/poly(A) polymerase